MMRNIKKYLIPVTASFKYMFLVPVNRLYFFYVETNQVSAKMFVSYPISKHIELTSIIHTDCCWWYNGLGFAPPLIKNHSYRFVDPFTGVNTKRSFCQTLTTDRIQQNAVQKRLRKPQLRSFHNDIGESDSLFVAYYVCLNYR